MSRVIGRILTLGVLLFLVVYLPAAALLGFPWTFLTRNVRFLWELGMLGARLTVALAGVRVAVVGRDRLDPHATYIFMCNHVSDLDPPIVVPALPRRTSVLVKKELFKVPILGRAMTMGSLVPVDRSNRDAAIASLRAAADVLRAGLNMTVFPEGTRSRDGRLLPFKKGPFYLALDSGVPIVPMTILGTFELMPKGQWYATPGKATVIFHEPIDPKGFRDKDELLAAVRSAIASALPAERRDTSHQSTESS